MKPLQIARRVLQVMALVVPPTIAFSQNVHMTGEREMNLWYNPALKTDKSIQTYANFKNVSYPQIVGYSSKSIAIELPLIPADKEVTDITPYANIAIGIISNSAKDASMASSSAVLAISYAVPLSGNDTYIEAGFSADYSFNKVGPGFLGYYPKQFDKQGALGDALVADPYQSGYNFGYFSANAGASILHNGENNQWYAGISTRSFNHPYTEWSRASKLQSAIGAQGGYTTSVNEVSAFGAYVNLNWQGNVHDHYFGVEYTRNLDDSANYKMVVGMGYRPGDAIVPSLGFRTRRSHFSFYYDINFPNTMYSTYHRKAYALFYRLILR